MIQIQYNIKTLSPILLTKISGDTNMVSTLDYIPGTSIRGIFAHEYIKQNIKSDAHLDDFFYNSFLNSGLYFTNAYYIKTNGKEKIICYPTPLSIKSTKEKGEISDLLIKEGNDQTQNLGNYCNIQNDMIDIIDVRKSINFHNTRKDRLKGHSDEGTIFNYESLDVGQEFTGKILGQIDELQKIFDLFEGTKKINIGRSKNIQYGFAELTLNPPEEYISDIGSEKPEEISDTFILTFLSPAIIYNDNGFPSTSFHDLRSYLVRSLGISAENIKILDLFKRTDTIENFIAIWLLKRPSETAIKEGSCFKISIIDFNEENKKLLIELQQTGLGERTSEGFGRFAINLQKVEKYHKVDINNNKPSKPLERIPETTKDIIKNVIKQKYYSYSELYALEDCGNFIKLKERIPSNSLIGRLELMLQESKSKKDFLEKLENLTKPTKEKLKNCRSEKSNLFTFFQKSDPIIFFTIKHKQLKEISSLINYQASDDGDFMFNIYRNYWFTFLASMRKEKKKGGN